MTTAFTKPGLYREAFEKDSCGFGLIANLDDKPSHWVVETAVGALKRLTHRGAVAADGKTGDGCGLLLKTPERFFREVAGELDFELGEQFAVGTVFLNQHKTLRDRARNHLNDELEREGLIVAGWRLVPVEIEVCGEEALRTLPIIQQIFVSAPEGMSGADFNRHLFIARRRTENRIADSDPSFYVASLSADTVSYKGMV
ncbi:MAG: glutamate synthase large subunit, partial [Pseudomonadota bacterium]